MNRKDNTGVTLWIKGLQIRPEIKCFTSSNHEEKLFLSKTLYINVHTSKIKLQPLFKYGKIPHTSLNFLKTYIRKDRTM